MTRKMKNQEEKSVWARTWGGNEHGCFKKQQGSGMRLEQSEPRKRDQGVQQESGLTGPPAEVWIQMRGKWGAMGRSGAEEGEIRTI